MKGLSIYTMIVVAFYQLFFLSELINGEDAFIYLLCMAIFAPMGILAYKVIRKK